MCDICNNTGYVLDVEHMFMCRNKIRNRRSKDSYDDSVFQRYVPFCRYFDGWEGTTDASPVYRYDGDKCKCKKKCTCNCCKDKRKKDGCFITTATLLHFGHDIDNCKQLEHFREVRDNYIFNNHPDLISEYYEIAPTIVKLIDNSIDKHQLYNDIWNNYLNKCLSRIIDKKHDEATIIYKEMVDNLKLKFNISS